MKRGGYVYVLSNKNRTTLYVGVTHNLVRRAQEHRSKRSPKRFTARYLLFDLLYYEAHSSIVVAIAREKQWKAGPGKKKEDLIHGLDPEWVDLSPQLVAAGPMG